MLRSALSLFWRKTLQARQAVKDRNREWYYLELRDRRQMRTCFYALCRFTQMKLRLKQYLRNVVTKNDVWQKRKMMIRWKEQTN